MADPVPGATFLNFLSGLASQALMQFGEIPNPISGERTVNPAYARYTVQLLEVLQQKTAGNRSPEEEQYLAAVLTDLRSRLTRLPSL
ncbi:MAG: DUF1844 domain-containing protein [Planctomycetes bacterium]|nr:DUF1844 domain-containing protein [Planctomycetota bacterium]